MTDPLPEAAAPEASPDTAWAQLRDPRFGRRAEGAVQHSAPHGRRITSMTRVRSSRGAAYRVDTAGASWLARVGVRAASDSAPADNTGFLGTSLSVPTGQKRQYDLAHRLAAAGAGTSVPVRYVAFDGFLDTYEGLDILWLPFLEDSDRPLTVSQWSEVLEPLHASRPAGELPVFTDRALALEHTDMWADRRSAAEAGARYDAAMARLFNTATRWGPVHGDAHSGSVLISGGRPVLLDVDTVCWAPLVWDLTLLLTRAGTDGNTGYTAGGLKDAFALTDEEVDAALGLHLIAGQIARGSH